TIAASTGTNHGSHASAASREPTRYTRSPTPACTVSTAAWRSPVGAPCSSIGCTIKSFWPSRPDDLRSATTVPLTIPRYIAAPLSRADERHALLGPHVAFPALREHRLERRREPARIGQLDHERREPLRRGVERHACEVLGERHAHLVAAFHLDALDRREQ